MRPKYVYCAYGIRGNSKLFLFFVFVNYYFLSEVNSINLFFSLSFLWVRFLLASRSLSFNLFFVQYYQNIRPSRRDRIPFVSQVIIIAQFKNVKCILILYVKHSV